MFSPVFSAIDFLLLRSSRVSAGLHTHHAHLPESTYIHIHSVFRSVR